MTMAGGGRGGVRRWSIYSYIKGVYVRLMAMLAL